LFAKLIKNDLKAQYWFFAILFAAAVILPFVVYLITPEAATEDIQYTLRLLAQNLGPAGVVIISLIFSAISLSENFSGNGAYLMFSIPAKTRSHIASKAIIFYLFFIPTIIIANLCGCLVDMDFRPLSEEIYSIKTPIENIINVSGVYNLNEYYNYIINFVCDSLNTLSIPLIIYSFILADISFGQLWGNHKKAGRIVFVVGAIVLFTTFGIFHDLASEYYFKRVWMFPESFTIHTLYSIRDIIDTVLMILVITALLRFSNWTYTKKINVI
jgi:hypothetical protein